MSKSSKSPLVEYHGRKASPDELGAQCVCCVVWHGCVWFCLLSVVVCSTLMGTLHTTTLHVVNRPHAEYVDRTKISPDCDAIKAESLSL